MPIDCNNGRNPTHAILQFASETEAKDSITKLHGKNLQDQEVVVSPITTDPEAMFAGSKIKPSKWFPDFERDYDVYEILKPAKEGRRIFVGGVWCPTIKPGTLYKAFKDAFCAYAVETMSKLKPNMQGRRHVFIDTATKEEADRVMDEMSEVDVLGTKLVLKRMVLKEGDKSLTVHSTRFLDTKGKGGKSLARKFPYNKEEW
jgi:RNA recognition motif-containing protein